MHEFLDEVAKEEVSPDELRELLRRLAVTEFGGPERAHVSDVSEATSTGVETLGRILADIRGESFEAWRARFQTTLESHQKRLENLEKRTSAIGNLAGNGLQVVGTRRAIAAAVLAAVLASSMFVARLSLRPRVSAPAPTATSQTWQDPGKKATINGHTFGYSSRGEWSEEDTQGKPGPIVHAQDAASAKHVRDAND